MKRATLSRRLLAGAAGLAIGVGGIIGLASPAQATFKETKVEFEDNCDGTAVRLQVGNLAYKYKASITAESAEDTIFESDDVKGQYIEEFVPSDAGEIRVKVYYKTSRHSSWTKLLDKKWTWKNPGWPGEGCDSPQVEIVEDCEGNVTVTIHAGDTRRTWRVDGEDERFLDFGESDTWDAASLDALVEWWHENSQQWKEADEEYVTRTEPRDCPTTPPDDDGGDGGGELPETGTPVMLVAGGALVLLTLGGVMFFMARRRQISFTA